jgi:cysteinyl-tRNA synthetase
MYVCGMTVQGLPHMGHMLAFVSADLVRRSLEYLGYEVLHVQNFTDIDDKIIEKANELGRDPRELAETNIEAYFAAADGLGILRAHRYPKVTEHIPQIVAFIERLIEAQHAYAAEGSVYFDVRSYPRYGELSGRRVDELRTAVRVELDDAKRDPLDFALWKAAKPGEPAWESPWGRGRPGWHIECSVMSTLYLGSTFDFHGGGRDLIFPHHENELAQAKALEGDFVRYWMHNGLLNLEGQKMAKSQNHFFLVEDVLGRYPADVVRFYLLRGHFRNQMEYSWERLDEAASAYDRMRRALVRLEELAEDADLGADLPDGVTSEAGVELEEAAQTAITGFRDALCDDFNAEAALAALFELVRVANPYLVERAAARAMDAIAVRRTLAVLREGLGVLGLFGEVSSGEDIPVEVQELARRRDQARKDRDFTLADTLRDEIAARGFRIEDSPDGSRIRRA